jgi:magnesium-transporting ATPase (P-type)
MPDGRVVLFCKGADAVLLARARTADADAARQLQGHVDAFARQGLRTLVYASTELAPARYAAWAAVRRGLTIGKHRERERAMRWLCVYKCACVWCAYGRANVSTPA